MQASAAPIMDLSYMEQDIVKNNAILEHMQQKSNKTIDQLRQNSELFKILYIQSKNKLYESSDLFGVFTTGQPASRRMGGRSAVAAPTTFDISSAMPFATAAAPARRAERRSSEPSIPFRPEPEPVPAPEPGRAT